MVAIFLILVGLFSSVAFTVNGQSSFSFDSVKNVPQHSSSSASSHEDIRYLEINRIFIIGNRLTRDQIILRELSLKRGDIIYSVDLPEILELDKRKLINTRLFNTVEIRPIELEENKVDLLIDLDERWYTFPSPIFELSDRNFNEWWQNYDHDFRRVNFGLRLYQFNMRGRNETLRATMQFGFQRHFDVAYRLPYIDRKQKHGLIVELNFKEAKNLAVRTNDHKLVFEKSQNLLKEERGAGLTYTYRNSFYETHAFRVEYRDTWIADTVLTINENFLGNESTHQNFVAMSYRFTSDRRDIAAYPLRGRYLFFNAAQYGIGANTDVNKTDFQMGYARYFDLKKEYYFSNYSYAYWSTPEAQPYNLFGALGYDKQILRGYEIYVIEGPTFLMNKATLKKKIFSRIYRWEDWPIEQFRHIPIAVYLKTYLDIGYVENFPNYLNNSRFTNILLVSGGAGVDIVSSYDAVLRLEYTFNNEGKGGFFINVKKEF